MPQRRSMPSSTAILRVSGAATPGPVEQIGGIIRFSHGGKAPTAASALHYEQVGLTSAMPLTGGWGAESPDLYYAETTRSAIPTDANLYSPFFYPLLENYDWKQGALPATHLRGVPDQPVRHRQYQHAEGR